MFFPKFLMPLLCYKLVKFIFRFRSFKRQFFHYHSKENDSESKNICRFSFILRTLLFEYIMYLWCHIALNGPSVLSEKLMTFINSCSQSKVSYLHCNFLSFFILRKKYIVQFKISMNNVFYFVKILHSYN